MPNIRELVTALRVAIADELKARGELQEGESISINALVLNRNGKTRKTTCINFGVGIIGLGSNVFYDRKLEQGEIDTLRNFPWEGKWQPAFVSHILQGNNEPMEERDLLQLAVNKGHRIKQMTDLYVSPMLASVNKQLSRVSQPFRIIMVEKKGEDGASVQKFSNSKRFYRFCRMVEV